MITCGRMTEEHVPAVAALLCLFFTEDEYYLDSSAAYGDGGEHALRQALGLFLQRPELGFVWTARDGSETVGVCVVCFAISTSMGAIVAKLDDVFVPSDRQNQGIGSTLLAALIRELKAMAVTRIDTSVHLDNDGARRFYIRHGFEPLHEERLSYVIDY